MAQGSLNEDGLTIPSYQELVTDANSAISTAVGLPLDLSPDSAVGSMSRTFNRTAFDLYQLLLSVYNSTDPSSAVGTQLDNLGTYLGVTRLSAKPATGFATFFTQNNVSIGSGYPITLNVGTTNVNTYTATSNSNVNFKIGDSNAINDRFCNAVVLSLRGSVLENNVYELIINNNTISYTATAADAADLNLFFTNLKGAINAVGTAPADGFIASSSANTYLLLQSATNSQIDLFKNGLNVDVVSNNFDIYGLSTLVSFTTNETGDDVKVFANSDATGENLNNVLFVDNSDFRPPSFVGSNDIVITGDWESGEDVESDEAYRQRLLGIDSSVTGTFGAIYEALLATTGVTTVNLLENPDWFIQNIEGIDLPPQSFAAFVSGGLDNDVAQAIYDTKPVSVPSVGNTQGVAIDAQGNSKTISFFRPEDLFVKVQVTVEIGTTSGDLTQSMIDQIKEAIKEAGDDLSIGEDIVPTKFIRSVFSALPQALWCEVVMDTNIVNDFPSLNYTDCRITVDANFESVFFLDNIDVIWGQCT